MESFFDHVDVALHVEVRFRNIIMFAIENFFEAFHRLLNRDVLAFGAGENFRDVKRLAQKSL